MALKKLPYSRLEPLLRENLSVDEEDSATSLIHRLRAAKKRGWFTPSELA